MNALLLTLALLAVDQPAPPAADELALLKTFREEFVAVTPGVGKFPAEASLGALTADGVGGVLRVKLARPFAMAKYEVPQNLWQAVMGANPSRWQGPRNSVEMLSRAEAEDFCKRVTAKLRAAKLINDDQVVRLPSEAEWEYCARAGTTTYYSFGDDVALLDRHGWHTGNAAGNDPPVGAKAPNPWGLYDMHGYLWEWCADDWQADVAQLPPDGRPYRSAAGDKTAKDGVLRSGSWKDKADQLGSASRRRADVTLRDDAVGLRCVLGKTGDER